MSSYIYFTFKRGDIYCPLNSYCRSTPMYIELDENFHIPFDGFVEWRQPEIDAACNVFRTAINGYENSINRQKTFIETLKSMNGPVNERVSAIEDAMTCIEDYVVEIEGLERCLARLEFMGELLEDAYGVDAAIYVGIESGYKS